MQASKQEVLQGLHSADGPLLVPISDDSSLDGSSEEAFGPLVGTTHWILFAKPFGACASCMHWMLSWRDAFASCSGSHSLLQIALCSVPLLQAVLLVGFTIKQAAEFKAMMVGELEAEMVKV